MAFITRFASDRRAAVAIIVAVCAPMFVVLSALAVDLGSIFMQTRQLQGIADLSALAAARDLPNGAAAVQATVRANNWSNPLQATVTPGVYSPDPALDPNKRFAAGAASPNAVRVVLLSQANLFFGQIVLGKATVPISRAATASQAQLAAFSIGSRLLAVQGGVPNAVLGALTGSQVNLSVMDYNALVSANVDALDYVSALRTRLSLTGVSFDKVLAAKLTAPVALDVLSQVLADKGQGQAAAAAAKLSQAATPSLTATLGQLIDLGPYQPQSTVADPHGAGVQVAAADLAQAVLLLAQGGRQVRVDLAAAVPGLANVTAWLAIGQRPTNSPWMTVTESGQTIIRTAQTRLYIDAQVGPGSLLQALGVASVDIPLYVELASAQARLGSLTCPAAPSGRSVALQVQTGVGTAAIGQVDTTRLSDFTTPLTVSPAQFLKTLLLTASGSSVVNVGGASWQNLAFNDQEIQANAVKTVSTNDLAQATVASLLGKLNIQVQTLGLGIGIGQGAVTSALSSILGAAAAPLDGVIDQVSDLLGVHLGQADVRINGVRCHSPALVG